MKTIPMTKDYPAHWALEETVKQQERNKAFVGKNFDKVPQRPAYQPPSTMDRIRRFFGEIMR